MASPRYSATYKQLMQGGAPGLRIDFATYNSAKLQTQRAAFLIKEFLCNNLAADAYDNATKLTDPWVLEWSCDGVTGPADASDSTDRITDHTKFATRADSDAAAVSYYVLRSGTQLRASWAPSANYTAGTVVTNNGNLYVCQNDGASDVGAGPTAATKGTAIADGETSWLYIGPGDGYLRMCVAFRTAADYFLSITVSTKYELAATTTFFPVAPADGAILSPGSTHQRWLSGSDASGDRILHISADDDGTCFWLGVARSSDIPTNGGCVVLGRIVDECADGVGAGAAVLALPSFLSNANATALKSNNGMASHTTLWSYDAANTIGGVLGARFYVQFNRSDCLLMAPMGYGASLVVPYYTTDGFGTRRRWPLAYNFQSWPLSHVAGGANNTGDIIWGAARDMHMGTPKDITMGLLFGKRWWCYGMLLFPNPSEIEPTAA